MLFLGSFSQFLAILGYMKSNKMFETRKYGSFIHFEIYLVILTALLKSVLILGHLNELSQTMDRGLQRQAWHSANFHFPQWILYIEMGVLILAQMDLI